MNCAPRVAAIHDLSGLGRCSLTVILPVLSVMGAQCCPLPTAVLSAHTAFPQPQLAAFQDLSDTMEQSLLHWEALGVGFDAIYSGFLGSSRQIGILRRAITSLRQKETLILVDPVMGDNGKIYRTLTPEMCRLMGSLSRDAHIITPNLTEAAILLGEAPGARPAGQAGVEEWLERLSLDGQRSVVITGISLAEGTIGAGCLDRRGGKIRFAMSRHENGSFSGTGDLFASVLLGGLLRGETLSSAVAQSVEFVRECVAYTLAAGTPPLDGVQFEPLLGKLL